MANINKIMVGDEVYDIVPAYGKGLKRTDGKIEVSIGSGLCYDSGGCTFLNIGSGLAFDDSGKIHLKLGTGLKFTEQESKIALNFGTAVDNSDNSKNCGIALGEKGFVIIPADFVEYLKSLGVRFS